MNSGQLCSSLLPFVQKGLASWLATDWFWNWDFCKGHQIHFHFLLKISSNCLLKISFLSRCLLLEWPIPFPRVAAGGPSWIRRIQPTGRTGPQPGHCGCELGPQLHSDLGLLGPAIMITTTDRRRIRRSDSTRHTMSMPWQGSAWVQEQGHLCSFLFYSWRTSKFKAKFLHLLWG